MRIPSGIIALCACARLAQADITWKPLPAIPHGTPRALVGNGTAIYALSGFYGLTRFSPTDGWTNIAVPGLVPAKIVAKDGLLAVSRFIRSDGVSGNVHHLFRLPADTGWRQSSSAARILATDGKRFLGASTDFSTAFVSVDSASSPTGDIPWRPITTGDNIQDAWIEAATIVLKGSRNSWISRDTGSTFAELGIPDLSELAIQHDTMVALSGSRKRAYRSFDNGRTWDSSMALLASGPRRLRVRGGFLWGQFLKSDTNRTELARSTDAGRTWSTTIADVAKDAEIAWDGRYFWLHSLEDGKVLRSPDRGESWMAGPHIPAGTTTKLRTVAGGILAMRSWRRNARDKGRELWFWDRTEWFKLRDSLRDFEVRNVAGAQRIFVIADRSTSEDSASELSLQWSDDRTSWTKSDRKPSAETIGNSAIGILIAEGTDLSISQDGIAWRSIRMEQTRGTNTRFLAIPRCVVGDTVALWGTSTGIFRWTSDPSLHGHSSPVIQTIPSLRTMDFVSVGGATDILTLDTAVYTANDLTETVEGWFFATKAIGAAPRGDSILVWGRSDTILVRGDSGSREVTGPSGHMPTLVYAEGGDIPGPFPRQSAIYVADENGIIYEGIEGKGSSTGPLQVRRSRMDVRANSIEVNTSLPSRIRLDLIGLDGTSRPIGNERNVSSGISTWELPMGRGIGIVRLWVDGKPAESRKVLLATP